MTGTQNDCYRIHMALICMFVGRQSLLKLYDFSSMTRQHEDAAAMAGGADGQVGLVTCLCNVALSMAESPDNGVNDKLELVRRHGEEGSKAVVSDGPQQAEELQPVLWELLHIKAQ